jgi:hypothetical protein
MKRMVQSRMSFLTCLSFHQVGTTTWWGRWHAHQNMDAEQKYVGQPGFTPAPSLHAERWTQQLTADIAVNVPQCCALATQTDTQPPRLWDVGMERATGMNTRAIIVPKHAVRLQQATTGGCTTPSTALRRDLSAKKFGEHNEVKCSSRCLMCTVVMKYMQVSEYGNLQLTTAE